MSKQLSTNGQLEIAITPNKSILNCGVICLLVMENIVKENFSVDYSDSTLVVHRKLLNEL